MPKPIAVLLRNKAVGWARRNRKYTIFEGEHEMIRPHNLLVLAAVVAVSLVSSVQAATPLPYADETIRNLSQVTWTDWHVSLLNGVVTQARVSQVGGDAWTVVLKEDNSGFDAFAANTPTSLVAPNQQLHVWFEYSPVGSESVQITEYPTFVPEPSSIFALLTGLAGLGLGIRRWTR